MNTSDNIKENQIFNNGGTKLHIKKKAQGCRADNPTKNVQRPHGNTNQQKNLVI